MPPDVHAGSLDRPADSIEHRVRAILAEALDVPLAQVRMHSSLIDDLGAESIDFLDIQFRIETEFSIQIPEDEIWEGSIGGTDQPSFDAAITLLRARMPDFRWDRLPAPILTQDLPRLITPQTIVDYLERRGVPAGPDS